MRLLGRNVFSTYTVYALSGLTGLILTPIILDALGVEEYGIWAFIGSITIFLALLDIGVGPAVVRFSAKHRGAGEQHETSVLASVALVAYGLIALVTMGAGAVLAYLVPILTDVPDDLVTPTRVATVLVVASLAARFPLGLFSNVLLGQQRYDVVNLGNFASLVVYAILVAVLIPRDGGIVLLALLTLVAAIVRLALPLPWLRREIPGLHVRLSYVTWPRLRELLTFSSHNFVIHIGDKIVFSADVIVVGIVLGPEAAAFYAIPAKLFALAFGFSTGGTQQLFAAFSELEGAGERERQRRYLLSGLRIGTAVVLLPAVPLIVLPDRLLEAWLGRSFDESVAVLILLACALVFVQPTNTQMHFLIARGHQRRFAALRAITVTINLGLSIALAETVGLWGVALATLATEAVFASLIAPALVRRSSAIPMWSIWVAWLRPVAIAVVAAIPTLVVPRLAPLTEVWVLVGLVIAWSLVFGLLIYRYGLTSDERATVRAAVARRRQRPTARSLTAESDPLGP